MMPVHLYGQTVDMDNVLNVGEELGVPIIEDAAQSILSTYDGKYIGNQFQADEGGIVRVIMESGDYIASSEREITGKTKRFNRESKKGIIFKL